VAIPRLPIAPIFDINQVLSAINQTVLPAAVPAGYDAVCLINYTVFVGIYCIYGGVSHVFLSLSGIQSN